MGRFKMLIPFSEILLPISYSILGGIIKFLDDVHDRNRQFSRRALLCWGLTGFTIILLDLWMYFDIFTALLTIALAMGLILIGKVDNYQFIAIALFTLPIAVYLLYQAGCLLLIPPMLLAFTPSAVLDEVLHDRSHHFNYTAIRWLVSHRPLMKIIVLILPFFGLFTIFHAIAFWFFDITYDLVAYRLGVKLNGY
ncbi:MAG: hypothetical protein ACFFDP_07615 [Promethearchaeota archaeon]